jgi:hypothetical protein
VLCLDEIFLPSVPILMAVEPHSLAGVTGQRGPDRSGESWCKVLRSWPCVKRVVADAGTGLERGVKLATEARTAGVETQEDDAVLGIDMGLDRPHPGAAHRGRPHPDDGGNPSGPQGESRVVEIPLAGVSWPVDCASCR